MWWQGRYGYRKGSFIQNFVFSGLIIFFQHFAGYLLSYKFEYLGKIIWFRTFGSWAPQTRTSSLCCDYFKIWKGNQDIHHIAIIYDISFLDIASCRIHGTYICTWSWRLPLIRDHFWYGRSFTPLNHIEGRQLNNIKMDTHFDVISALRF